MKWVIDFFKEYHDVIFPVTGSAAIITAVIFGFPILMYVGLLVAMVPLLMMK